MQTKMNNKIIGLYFGSFNPIHIGHLLVATHTREAAQLDEVWFIVSPQNPFKLNSELADEQHRLNMVQLSVQQVDYFKASDIEFNLPKPSYTYITLQQLQEKHPEHTFKLIIGEDNVAKFDNWKEVQWIKDNFEILVYNRQTNNSENTFIHNTSFTILKLPMLDISSTAIRKRIKEEKIITFFTSNNVEKYIKENNLYK